jgi:two-component system chemotaxis response regulator CheY
MVDLSKPVLVVDDYKTVVRIVENLLTSIGFTNVDEAGSVDEAFAKLGKRRYSLVIADWHMQPTTGYDFLVKLRSGEERSRTQPFIMMTADSSTENVVAARRAGVDNYILKPFNAQTLRRKIAAVLGEF